LTGAPLTAFWKPNLPDEQREAAADRLKREDAIRRAKREL
jgi:hypothetical protein